MLENSNLYGEEYVTYNIHGLKNITNFVTMHGSHDRLNAFKFENYLQLTTKTVHSSKYPLQDVYNRTLEQNVQPGFNVKDLILKKEISLDHSLFQDIIITLFDHVILKIIKMYKH